MDEDRSQPREGKAPSPRPERVRFRDAAAWGLGLVATLGAAIAAGTVAVVLTAFGLGGVVLAAIAGVVLVGATVWRRGMLPLSVIALALALPAAWAANADQRLDRSHGSLTVAPRVPSDIAHHVYRRGMGRVLIDLRRFAAPDRSTTRIAARADSGRLVVALPTDRCFNLDVRFQTDELARPSLFAIRAAHDMGVEEEGSVETSSLGLTTRASQADSDHSGRAALAADRSGSTTLPYGLLAFNRWAREAGHYKRAAVGDPEAPTVRLNLRAAQQIVLRDYPTNVDPMAFDFPPDGGDPVGGLLWPSGLHAPARPTELSSVRTPENRARWIAWEQELIGWAKAQAERAAGPCASRADVRDRGFKFLTQPETVRSNGRSDRLLGTPPSVRSSIPQQTATTTDAMLLVEVDGLGETRLLGVRPGAATEAPVWP